jgi:hypothetical protein
MTVYAGIELDGLQHVLWLAQETRYCMHSGKRLHIELTRSRVKTLGSESQRS